MLNLECRERARNRVILEMQRADLVHGGVHERVGKVDSRVGGSGASRGQAQPRAFRELRRTRPRRVSPLRAAPAARRAGMRHLLRGGDLLPRDNHRAARPDRAREAEALPARARAGGRAAGTGGWVARGAARGSAMPRRADRHGAERPQRLRGEGRGVSDSYGVRDAACPIRTG